MGYLLGKEKTKYDKDGYYLILNSIKDLYVIPQFNSLHEYQDDFKLEENQWFVVENFSDQKFFNEFLSSKFDSTAYSELPRTKYPSLIFIVYVTENIVCFQRIVKSTILQKKLIDFRIEEAPTLLNCQYTITINQEADAYYDKKKNKLYFKRLSNITSIFPGISELYKEATNEETEAFLTLDIFSVSPTYNSSCVMTANRRRIKEANERYHNFNAQSKIELPNYIRTYCPDLKIDPDTNKYIINGETDLTEVLNGINQRYYTTKFDKEKRLANSVTRLK